MYLKSSYLDSFFGSKTKTMNSNQTTCHLVFFLLFTNGAVLDLKLGILAKIQFGHLSLNFFQLTSH